MVDDAEPALDRLAFFLHQQMARVRMTLLVEQGAVPMTFQLFRSGERNLRLNNVNHVTCGASEDGASH